MPGTRIFHKLPQVAPLEDYADDETKACNKVSAFQKAMVLLPIVLSTTVSYILLVSNRASTQTIVQILAAILGACLLLTVGQVLNFLTRRSLLRHPTSLDLIDFLNGLAISHMNWSLPLPYLCLLCLGTLLALTPSALWAGALTPVSVSVAAEGPFFIKVPAWSNATRDLWQQNWYQYAKSDDDGPALQTNLGIFSYAVHTTRFGYFINDGSAASTLDGQPPKFAKADNTNYTYNGRSFSAGASVGLNNSSITMAPHILSYSYNETTYHVEYQCTYNGPVVLLLEVIQYEQGGIKQWYANASSGRTGGYRTGNFFSTDIVVAAATMSLEKFILNTRGYPQLENVTCIADIKPSLFNVSVNVGLKQITVTPLVQDQIDNVEQTNRIA
ncbi:hypothetical protein PG984_001328 [Apiospora sp. TS-2023a]